MGKAEFEPASLPRSVPGGGEADPATFASLIRRVAANECQNGKVCSLRNGTYPTAEAIRNFRMRLSASFVAKDYENSYAAIKGILFLESGLP